MMDTLFDIEPAPRMDPQSPQLYRPVARRDDPDTSHKAAESVRNITATKEEILEILRLSSEPLTDDQIAFAHLKGVADRGWRPASPSGLRSRRSELVDAKLVGASKLRAITPSGRTAIRWWLVDKLVESVENL